MFIVNFSVKMSNIFWGGAMLYFLGGSNVVFLGGVCAPGAPPPKKQTPNHIILLRFRNKNFTKRQRQVKMPGKKKFEVVRLASKVKTPL